MPSAIVRNFHRTFATLAAAARAAYSVESRRPPNAADLKALEIDPKAYHRINL
jgi:hypothetical protein